MADASPTLGMYRVPATRGACPFDPPPVYERLRDEEPVARVKTWDDTPIWLVTRFDDVRFVLSDDRFSADSLTPGFPVVTPAQSALATASRSFIRMDPPEHDRLRRTLTREFTIRRIEALRPRIQRIVDRFAAGMTGHSPPADLVAEFALPIPSLVICLLLGVPYEDHLFFQRCSSTLLSARATEAAVAAASEDLFGYIDRLAGRKAVAPADDLLGRLLGMEAAGRLTRREVVGMSRLLLVAGHETTANMIALSVLALLCRPGQLAKLRENPSLVPGAVEELLRYLTIVQNGLPRVARTDVMVGGGLIRAGEGVLCCLPAANRDETYFADPGVLEVTRNERGHIAFGFGVHQCLGQPLARVELQVALEALVRRMPALRLAVPFEELQFRHDMIIYGVHELPVTWERG